MRLRGNLFWGIVLIVWQPCCLPANKAGSKVIFSVISGR